MKSLHLTLMVFCHVLLASVVFYFTSLAAASPLKLDSATHKLPEPIGASKVAAEKPAVFAAPPAAAAAQLVEQRPQVQVATEAKPEPRSALVPPVAESPKQAAPVVSSPPVDTVRVVPVEPIKNDEPQPALTERKLEKKPPAAVELKREEAPPVAYNAPLMPVVTGVEAKAEPQVELEMRPKKAAAEKKVEQQAVEMKAKSAQEPPAVGSGQKSSEAAGVVQPQAAPLVAEQKQQESRAAAVPQEPISVVVKHEEVKPVVQSAPVAVEKAPAEQSPSAKSVERPAAVVQPQHSAAKAGAPVPVVMGGLGPLHLLATTLCSYQPDRPVADEHLNQLYARRANVRKTLLEFMSLKFTNLEKLSLRLGHGLRVVPAVPSSPEAKSPGVSPSHGWPVVGKCTAHDLRLMGEAAWCECQEQGCPGPGRQPAAVAAPADALAKSGEPKVAAANSGEQAAPPSDRVKLARSISESSSFLPSPEDSSVISKLLHVSDIRDAPTVESTIYNLNLTQHQLATLEAHATSTQECRRNSLRYTKALFNHLAEDQREVSGSWPQLYALLSADDCARKRVIDIVNALSGFRTDTTSIRRDNLEFAFAMDDLRAKVLESEVNVPLTFDRDFIEVEQFLQQSVRLMLDNVQPKRAKVTSLRYRSLMYGASQQAFDDQCIDLHQRLLARNYPNDCNPTQFGQLPDVLRMTASSLELWSIEKELSLYMAKVADYPNSNGADQQKVKEDVNECIANLVSS